MTYVAPPAGSLPAPVFIIALPKSYTSILSGMLGQHPELVSVPELNLFTGETVSDWANQPGNAYLCDGLLRTLAQGMSGEQTPHTVQMALGWLQERQNMPVTDVFDDIRRMVAPAALIEQSPGYSRKPAFVQRILKAYPDARFIHMTRNPVTWLSSMAKWGQAGQMMLQLYRETDVGAEAMHDPIALWQSVQEGMAAMLAPLGPQRYIQVLGEDTVSRTEPLLVRILDWLGLDASPQTLSAMLHPERSPFACWGPPGARGGNNPDFLTSPALRTRTDRDKIMYMDRAQCFVPKVVLTYARTLGYQ